MNERGPLEGLPGGLGDRIWRGMRARRRRRTVSLFLMAAMLVMLLLGARFAYMLDNPRDFAFYLSLYFVFFLVVIARAAVECFDIVREHLRDRESVFRDTFAKDGFAEELGTRVAKGDRRSWPEF